MNEDMSFLKKPVTDWTEDELRRADRFRQTNPNFINKDILPVIDARLEAADANRKMVSERLEHAAEKRKLLVSFVDTSSKPARSLDVRSVKHSVSDATGAKNGGGPAITAAGIAYAYEWLCNHPEIMGPLKSLPPIVWLVVVFGGAGWWLILFAQRLSEKWAQSYGEQ